jgi:hypothetical protein
MNISNWEYDFSSLPYWDNREKTDVTDKLYESTHDFCLLNYSISEVRMLDFRGFLALFKNKAAPQLVFNCTALNFPKCTPFFAESVPFCAVLASVYCEDIQKELDVTLIIDLAKNRFAFAPLHQSDVRELHPMTEEKKGLFLLLRDGSKRNVTKLTYHPFDKAEKIEGVAIKMNMFGNVQIAPRLGK